jgi:hypothetical protein
MMKVLVDAELILEFFLNRNEYAKDAERLLEKVESRQIQLYITQLCLDKVRSEDKFRAKPDAKDGGIAYDLEKIFSGYVIPYDDCLIGEQVFQSIENTRNFECTVEKACAKAFEVGAVVTHKPEEFAGSGLLVWSVTELLTIISLGDFVCQVLHKEVNFIVPINVSESYENRTPAITVSGTPSEVTSYNRTIEATTAPHYLDEQKKSKKIEVKNSIEGLLLSIYAITLLSRNVK